MADGGVPEKILIYGNSSLIREGAGEDHRVVVTRSVIEVKKRVAVDSFLLIIIDLDGHERKGMELAAHIRGTAKQYTTPIIFLSKDRRQEWDAFHKIGCSDFYVKPLKPGDRMQMMYFVLKRINKACRHERVLFTVGAELYPISINDIRYLQCEGRGVKVFTMTGELLVPSLCISEFANEYSDAFLQIHRGTVVNSDMVRCINFSAGIMELRDDGERLVIGRTYLPVLKKRFGR